MLKKSFLQTTHNGCKECSDTKRTRISHLPHLITVAEDLIMLGRNGASVKRFAKSMGRPRNKKFTLREVGDHLPIEGSTRHCYSGFRQQ